MPNTEERFPALYVDRKAILDNGITVVTRAVDRAFYHPERSLFSVNVMAGNRYAGTGRAHFLEHLIAHQGHEAALQRFAASRSIPTRCTSALPGLPQPR